MRTLVALAVASVLSALLIVVASSLNDVAFRGYSLPVLSRFFEQWAVIAIGIATVYCIIGYPVIALLARFRVLKWPIVAATGAAAGLVLGAILSLLPTSDLPTTTTTLMQQLAPWLKFALAGALSAAILGYLLRPVFQSKDADPHVEGKRPGK